MAARPAPVLWVPLPDVKGTCAACRVVLPFGALEVVPTRPDLDRCRDSGACAERFRPRALARSVRRLP
jgi:hypothetical protein